MDRYGDDVLARDRAASALPSVRPVPAETGLVVELPDSGFVGAVLGVEAGTVRLEDRRGVVRAYPLGRGFLVEGESIELVAPRGRPRDTGRARSVSGSFLVTDTPARVARESRIWVEGRHDAELVEKIWGHDLRVEGVVVEYLEGVDHLAERLRAFGPTPQRRVGMLVDHWVTGSKEERLAREALRGVPRGSVLIVGHPFVDVWQAIRPQRIGHDAWPTVPRDREWKAGVLQEFGWPHDDQEDIARAWQRILGSVRHFGDLEPALLGRVEQLIDFVTDSGD